VSTQHSSVVDGVRLHWMESGRSTDKAPLLLLHGLNDSHQTWKRVAPLLATDRRVLMLDAPGCGLSERPDASYALAWHADMIARWLERLGISEIDVIGHSFGGGVAQVLLLEPTLTIRRLGLVSAGGLGPGIALWLRLAALPGVVEQFGQPFMAAGTRWFMRAAGGGISAQDIEAMCAMNSEPGSARAFARTVHDVISWRGQSKHFFPRAYEIARLPPITLFWGDDDTITPIEEALAFARKVQGVGFERFAGCGHYLQHEQPDRLAQKMREFLDSPRPRATLPPRPEARARMSLWQRHLSSLWTGPRRGIALRT
jgi:pimeloyl-ACP methyl ester carboxylesterase